MARTTDEINAIIAGLKTNRDTRDAYIEGKAAAFDDSNAYEANQIRGLKHTQSKLLDIGYAYLARPSITQTVVL